MTTVTLAVLRLHVPNSQTLRAGRSLPITIKVYLTVNVLNPGDVYSGDISDDNIATQIAVMNSAFAKAGVRPLRSTGLSELGVCEHRALGSDVRACGREPVGSARAPACLTLEQILAGGLELHRPRPTPHADRVCRATHRDAHAYAAAALLRVQASFVLANTNRVNQPQYWNIDANSDDLANFKAVNYQGGYQDLNLFTTMLQNSVLG